MASATRNSTLNWRARRCASLPEAGQTRNRRAAIERADIGLDRRPAGWDAGGSTRDRGRGQRAQRGKVMQDAGGKLVAEPPTYATFAPRRKAPAHRLVQENSNGYACRCWRRLGSGNGRETRPMAQTEGDRLCELPGNHRVVRGAHARPPAPRVTSNCCAPYRTGTNQGTTPAWRIAASSASPNSPCCATHRARRAAGVMRGHSAVSELLFESREKLESRSRPSSRSAPGAASGADRNPTAGPRASRCPPA